MLSLAEGLEKKGFKNYVACPSDSYMFRSARERGLAAFPLVIKGSFDPIGIVNLLRIVQKEKIDILHAHQGKVFWPCVIVKRITRTKVVFHRHAQLPHRFYSRGHYQQADRVISISNVVAKELIEREKVPSEKMRIIYNGTDFARFHSSVPGSGIRDRYGFGDNPVIGTVAAMNRPKGKGQEYLIKAAAQIQARFPQACYLIVGDGPIRGGLERLAHELGVSDKIIFTGYCEDVEKYIAAMDIFCFLSWDTEGFGQVMVEAQAMGKPVIGTDIGGIPETFQPGVTGYLIRPRDTEALTEALLDLLVDAALRSRMGRAAEQFVRENFSIDSMVNNTIGVYREIFDERA